MILRQQNPSRKPEPLLFCKCQRSQGHPHLHHPGSWCPLPCNCQRSQGHLCLYHLGIWGLVLHNHQGCWDQGSLPGWLTPQVTCQDHQTPGGTSHPRGRQESDWLSLCMSSCPTSQPCRTYRCTGSLVPLINGTGTHVPSIYLITRSLCQ